MRLLQSSHYPFMSDGMACAERMATHLQKQVVRCIITPHKQSLTVSISVHPAKQLLSEVTSPQLANNQTVCLGAEHKLFNICASGSGLCKMNEPTKVICQSEGAKTGCQTAGHSDISLPITLRGLGPVWPE